jgi:hypothetical protein
MKKPIAKPVKPVAVKSTPTKAAAKAAPIPKAVPKGYTEKTPTVRSKGDPSKDYRGQRKYTVIFLQNYIDNPAEIRARMGTSKKGPVTLDELMAFLREIEDDPRKSQLRGQPGPDGKPRKPGRPRKEEAVAAAPAKVNSKATLAAAAAGKTLAPKKGAAPAPAVKKPMPLKKK